VNRDYPHIPKSFDTITPISADTEHFGGMLVRSGHQGHRSRAHQAGQHPIRRTVGEEITAAESERIWVATRE
jgi:hypothetical protein